MTTTYAWGATGMRQIDDPEKVNVAFVQHEDFARAEAEVARLKARENDETMRVYGVSLQRALGRIAALEAERDAWKSKLLAEEVEHDATMAERDALHADAVAIFEWMNRKGGMGLDVHRRIDTFLATWSKP